MTFKDIFPGLSRTKVIFQDFQDFPGPGIFKNKIQDIPGGVGTWVISTIKDHSDSWTGLTTDHITSCT